MNIFKEVWKNNKRSFLISSIILVFGCILIYGTLGSPLKYSIPFSISSSFMSMFIFGLFFGDDK